MKGEQVARRNKKVLHFTSDQLFFDKRAIVLECIKENFPVVESYYNRVDVKVSGIVIKIAVYEVSNRGGWSDSNKVRIVVSEESPTERKQRYNGGDYHKSFSEGEGTGKPRLSMSKVFKYIYETAEILSKKLRASEKKQKALEFEQMLVRNKISKTLGDVKVIQSCQDIFTLEDDRYINFQKREDDSINILISQPYTNKVKLNKATSKLILKISGLLKELDVAYDTDRFSE